MSDPMYLHVQAERGFRLARGPAGPRLADELEALGRAFEREARELEVPNGRQGPFGAMVRQGVRFAPDSPLEGDGFELPVPVRQRS
jgi:hypothetical protein